MVDTKKRSHGGGLRTREAKYKSYCRRFIRREIEGLKDTARIAYAAAARKEIGEELTEEENKLLDDQKINNLVINKLEDILEKLVSVDNRCASLSEQESFTAFRFFYLVRLAQQGFLHLISSVYPALESQAIIYLADAIVGASMHASMNIEPKIRRENKEKMRKLVRNLYTELDEPVADGFKTTFKQIMQASQMLAGEGIREEVQEEKKELDDEKKEPTEEDVDDEAKEPAENTKREEKPKKKNSVYSGPTTMPPIWVVMPYNNMLDNHTFALPGAIPSLPFPTSLLPNSALGPNMFPFTQTRSQHRTKPDRRSRRDSKTTHHKKQEEDVIVQADEETQTKVEEQKADEGHKEEEKQGNEEHSHNHNVEDDEEESEDDEEDKFADPDTSDEYDSEYGSDHEERKDKQDDKESSALEEKDNTPNNKDEPAKPEEPKKSDVPSSWWTYAASNDETGENHLSSRRSSNRSSPRLNKK